MHLYTYKCIKCTQKVFNFNFQFNFLMLQPDFFSLINLHSVPRNDKVNIYRLWIYILICLGKSCSCFSHKSLSLLWLKISFIECPSVVLSSSDYDDIPIGVHGGLPRGWAGLCCQRSLRTANGVLFLLCVSVFNSPFKKSDNHLYIHKKSWNAL